MFGSIGTFEILIIVLVALLIFGNDQIKDVVRSIVKAKKDIEKATYQVRQDISDVIQDREDYKG